MGRSRTGEPRTTCVYAIGDADQRFVKIGYSANMDSRFRSIQASCPLELRILQTWPGGAELEDELHKHFADYRRRGEWFEFPDGLDSVESISMAVALASRVNLRGPAVQAVSNEITMQDAAQVALAACREVHWGQQAKDRVFLAAIRTLAA